LRANESGIGLLRHLLRRGDLVALGVILLQKSFCTGGRKFCEPPMRLSCKDVGASSPHVKLTGDLANVSAAIRIGDCFPYRNFAKNQSPCNFRLLQQYRGNSGHRADTPNWSFMTHRVISPPSIDAVRKGHFAKGRYGTFAITGSISLDAGELDDLAPFLGFVSDELAELFRRHRPRLNA
jgi:hypothetical protein